MPQDQASVEFAETTVQCPSCRRTVDIMEIVDAGPLAEGVEKIRCNHCGGGNVQKLKGDAHGHQ